MLIDDKLAKMVLANYEDLKHDIQKKLKLLYKEIESEDSCLAEVAYKKICYDKIGGSSKAINDLTEVVDQHQRLVRNRGIEVRKAMLTLMKREDTYRRIWSCYNLLEPDAYNILTRLYVENELYVTVEEESGLSHKTFEYRRKQAMKDIISLCNSTLANEEIMRIRLKTKEASCDDVFIQISFDI